MLSYSTESEKTLNKINSFQSAERFLSGGRNPRLRKISGIRSTWVRRDVLGRYIAIVYHSTEVVRYWRNGSITAHTAGFRTLTTKNRINEFANMRIFQRKHVWYTAQNVEYYDGIECNPDFSMLPHCYKMQNLPLES